MQAVGGWQAGGGCRAGPGWRAITRLDGLRWAAYEVKFANSVVVPPWAPCDTLGL